MILCRPQLLALALSAFGCAACASVPEKPPCDQATAMRLSAEAAFAGERCVQAGIPESQCTERQAVYDEADRRQAFCSKRIEDE